MAGKKSTRIGHEQRINGRRIDPATGGMSVEDFEQDQALAATEALRRQALQQARAAAERAQQVEPPPDGAPRIGADPIEPAPGGGGEMIGGAIGGPLANSSLPRPDRALAERQFNGQAAHDRSRKRTLRLQTIHDGLGRRCGVPLPSDSQETFGLMRGKRKRLPKARIRSPGCVRRNRLIHRILDEEKFEPFVRELLRDCYRRSRQKRKDTLLLAMAEFIVSQFKRTPPGDATHPQEAGHSLREAGQGEPLLQMMGGCGAATAEVEPQREIWNGDNKGLAIELKKSVKEIEKCIKRFNRAIERAATTVLSDNCD